jgi:hypothetical protein
MRWMTWLLGIMVLLAWQDALHSAGRGVDTWYVVYAILWFLAGAGALLTGVIRLVAGKMKAGALGEVSPPRRDAPAAQKGE